MGVYGLILMAGGLFLAAVHGQEILFEEHFSHGIGEHWRKLEFTGETRHTVQQDGTNTFVAARAASSASGLVVKLDKLNPEGTRIRWRWKIDRIPEGGTDSELKTFDHTGRLFVAFNTFIGPPRSINYVWANEVPAGGVFRHPSSGRSRFIALQSGNARAGEWITEERDLVADWRHLFGNDKPPDIVGLGFMTDSDGTKTTVTGCYDAIKLSREK